MGGVLVYWTDTYLLLDISFPIQVTPAVTLLCVSWTSFMQVQACPSLKQLPLPWDAQGYTCYHVWHLAYLNPFPGYPDPWRMGASGGRFATLSEADMNACLQLLR